MNGHTTVKKLINQKAKDYTFTIVFFIVFSFFAFFVIRPNLTTVFGLQKELNELKRLDGKYEKAITDIISIQSVLEKNRDLFPLLDQAVPAIPQVNQVIDDINKIASASNMPMRKVAINQVVLKEGKSSSTLKQYQIEIEASSDFVTANKFIDKILQQRRLKSMKELTIGKENKESSQSSTLNIKFDIEGYYL